MTFSKMSFVVLALGLSLAPAIAEAGDAASRAVSTAETVTLIEGRQVAMTTTGTTDAERYVIDRNRLDSHNH